MASLQVTWSNTTVEELVSSNYISEHTLVQAPAMLIESNAPSSDWRPYLIFSIIFLWLSKEKVWGMCRSFALDLWFAVIRPFTLFFAAALPKVLEACRFLRENVACALAVLSSALETTKSLVFSIKVAVAGLMPLHEPAEDDVDAHGDGYFDYEYPFPRQTLPALDEELIVELPNQRCLCPDGCVASRTTSNLRSEVETLSNKLDDKRQVIRILRGELTSLQGNLAESNQQKEQTERSYRQEEAQRSSDASDWQSKRRKLKSALKDATEKNAKYENEIADMKAQLQLAAMLNQPAPELEEDLPEIDTEMNKADIIETHNKAMLELSKVLKEERYAAVEKLQSRHEERVSTLENLISILNTEITTLKADALTDAAENEHQKTTIQFLRMDLASMAAQFDQAHTRSEKLYNHLSRQRLMNGKEKCCHISDLELNLTAAKQLQEVRLVMGEDWERLDEELGMERTQSMRRAVLTGSDREGQEKQYRVFKQIVGVLRDSGISSPEDAVRVLLGYEQLVGEHADTLRDLEKAQASLVTERSSRKADKKEHKKQLGLNKAKLDSSRTHGTGDQVVATEREGRAPEKSHHKDEREAYLHEWVRVVQTPRSK